MIIEGSFDSLQVSDSFDLVDENGDKIVNIRCNKFLPDKLYILNPKNNKEYVGQVLHNPDSEEFVFYEESDQLFHVWQKSGLGMPKFEIKSSLSEFSTKFFLRKRNVTIFKGDKEIATLIGSPPNYKIVVDESDNDFIVLCMAFAITVLIPLKTMYSLIS